LKKLILDILFRYLNNQHIRKQKISDAELNYGSLSLDHNETMKEIGELGLEIWKRQVGITYLYGVNLLCYK